MGVQGTITRVAFVCENVKTELMKLIGEDTQMSRVMTLTLKPMVMIPNTGSAGRLTC